MVFSERTSRMVSDKHDAEEAPVHRAATCAVRIARTPVNRTRNFHNFSLETPEFFDDIYLRLTNAETPRSRLIYPVQAPNGTVYRVLTRGR